MSQFSAVPPVDPAARAALPNRFSELKSEDFIRIIFTELTNQDPFSPNDTSALLDQLNSLRSIESDLKLIERLESLVFENQLASSANLIGKSITGLTEDSDRVSGTVVSVLRQGDTVSLELESGYLVPVENVVTIHEAPSSALP